MNKIDENTFLNSNRGDTSQKLCMFRYIHFIQWKAYGLLICNWCHIVVLIFIAQYSFISCCGSVQKAGDIEKNKWIGMNFYKYYDCFWFTKNCVWYNLLFVILLKVVRMYYFHYELFNKWLLICIEVFATWKLASMYSRRNQFQSNQTATHLFC